MLGACKRHLESLKSSVLLKLRLEGRGWWWEHLNCTHLLSQYTALGLLVTEKANLSHLPHDTCGWIVRHHPSHWRRREMGNMNLSVMSWTCRRRSSGKRRADIFFFFFFFFCVPQLYFWGSPLLGEIFAYVTVF